MMERIDANLPPLAGVIHSVGVLSDAALTNQTWGSFQQVLWPKIVGAWHLHRATAHRDLDMFVLFSSRVGRDGQSGPGQPCRSQCLPGSTGGSPAGPGSWRDRPWPGEHGRT